MPYLLLALLSTLWGTSFLLIKLAASGFDAIGFAFGRLAVGALALALAAALGRWRWPDDWRIWAVLLTMAVVGQALPIFALGAAARLTTSADLAMTMGAAPFATIVFARLFGLGEPWSLPAAVGLGLGLLGLAIALGAPIDATLYPRAGWGRALGLVAAVLYAAGALVSRFASRSVGPAMAATASMALSASLSCIVWFGLDGWEAPKLFAAAPTPSLVALIALGCFNTALAYLVYFRLVESSGATFAALNNYIVPFIGLALGAVWLGEPVALGSWVGLGLVIVGVVVTGWAARAPAVRSRNSS